ncbi:hypothetical protein ACJQWK_01937 [Exserohilum turcicum]|uniref:Uncharacterized protein n=1 Tax=Exserohilum turcicum (strain 28A) TaxID=671987 RepID=R0KJG4_EXST2|nr:uncharacterized protein SETTUDRAFT_38796 [Exserohilum turcica Et28A]EOA88117.1 hypothetical protein SETTUDRAFT_38796 [Exserohilum turcica Et28A]
MRVKYIFGGLSLLASLITPGSAVPTTQIGTVLKDGFEIPKPQPPAISSDSSITKRVNASFEINQKSHSLSKRYVISWRRMVNLVLKRAVGKFVTGTQWTFTMTMQWDFKLKKLVYNAASFSFGEGSAEITGDPGLDYISGTEVNVHAVVKLTQKGIDDLARITLNWVDDVYTDGFHQFDHYGPGKKPFYLEYYTQPFHNYHEMEHSYYTGSVIPLDT